MEHLHSLLSQVELLFFTDYGRGASMPSSELSPTLSSVSTTSAR